LPIYSLYYARNSPQFTSNKYGLQLHTAVKSSDCLKNEHGLCPGFTKEEHSSPSADTSMCACACHDPMYQLVRNSIALVNQSARNNPYQFTASEDS
jgi:hypothetical protein